MFVLTMLAMCGVVTMAVLDSGRGVDRLAARELAGVRAQAIAESAIEEVAHRIATGVNDPESALYSAFREELARRGSLDVPPQALGGQPRTHALAAAPPYGGEVRLESVSARVAHSAAVVPSPRRAYERTGLLAYEAAARSGAVVRRVRVEQEFRVALVTLPRPFDRMAFYVDDARRHLEPAQRALELAARHGAPIGRPGWPHLFDDAGARTRVVLVRGRKDQRVHLTDLDPAAWAGDPAAARDRVQRMQDLLEEYRDEPGPAGCGALQELFDEKLRDTLEAKVMWSVRPERGERADTAFARVWAMVDPARRALNGVVRVHVPAGDVLHLTDRDTLRSWRRGRAVLVVEGDCELEDVAERPDGVLVVIARGAVEIRGRVTAGVAALARSEVRAGSTLKGALIAASAPSTLSGALEYDPRLSSGDGEAPHPRALVVGLSPARARVETDRSLD
jgi:hypothetical protein